MGMLGLLPLDGHFPQCLIDFGGIETSDAPFSGTERNTWNPTRGLPFSNGSKTHSEALGFIFGIVIFWDE